MYGAVVCLGQLNLKRMVAYSSVSHMGLIFLGIATLEPLGIAGAIHDVCTELLAHYCSLFVVHSSTITTRLRLIRCVAWPTQPMDEWAHDGRMDGHRFAIDGRIRR